MFSDLGTVRRTAAMLGVAAVGMAGHAIPFPLLATAEERDRCTASGSSVTGARPQIRLVRNARGDAIAVDIVGMDTTLTAAIRGARPSDVAWGEAFTVGVSKADSSLPPLAGRYDVVGHDLRFQPAYPFVRGLAYTVRLDERRIGAVTRTGETALLADCARLATLAVDTSFAIPKTHASTVAEVTAVYPTAGVLPMNQLKLYVHFSAPMRAGEAAAHVRIVDEADGRVVPDAFFSPEDELWNPSQTRLTMLFDPGRIKRGLRPNEEAGLPLREGHRYRLVIDGAWPDANGDTLRAGFEKRFAVVAPDRAAPRPATWSISSPRPGTLDTLTIAFGESMDAALLGRVVTVSGGLGRASLGGRSILGRREDRWHFVPADPWHEGRYSVDVGTELEDLAGNNLRRLFDTDLEDRAAPGLEHRDRVSLTVTVASQQRSATPQPPSTSADPGTWRIATVRAPQVPTGPAAATATANTPPASNASWLRVGAPDLRSADVLTFAPDGLLLVGDSRGSAVFALDVQDSGAATSADIAVSDIDAKVAARLGTTPREISIRDMAVHPRSHNVYLSVVRGRDAGAAPALVRVSAGGRVDLVSLASIRFARASLPNPPRAGVEIEGDPAWKWTISAMAVIDGRVYVAGMTNEEFSSTVRQLPLPFTGAVTSTGLRIYHAHHIRYETESPITAFAPYTFFGRKFLVAAYACTPLVLFATDSLKDGAKVTGKTIAELGGGNVVRDILPFEWEGKRYLAISNRHRSPQLLDATMLPNAPLLDEHSANPASTAQYGLGSWLAWGVQAGTVAQVGILELADFDADHAVAIQRDVETGALNLRLLKKPILWP